MISEELSAQIDDIVKQFLCNIPIKDFNWGNIFDNLTYESQEILANRTVNAILVTKYPIQINYQKAFLKSMIENLEEQSSEIHDDLYSAYGRLVALSPTNTEYFKHYSIGNQGNIMSLKENINLISDGTTGLRTWQAALVLSEWSLANIETFKDNVVLELGSGVGLTGLTIAKECSPSCIYLTDCHPSVLNILCDNMKLNIEEITSINDCKASTDDSQSKLKQLENRCLYHNLGKLNVFVLNLPWEDVNKESCTKLGTINTVIAADVVYDSELFDPLISALRCFVSFCSVNEFIFSCTERNKSTLDEFLERIGKACFVVEELKIPTQRNFIWPKDTPVRLFRFTSK